MSDSIISLWAECSSSSSKQKSVELSAALVGHKMMLCNFSAPLDEYKEAPGLW